MLSDVYTIWLREMLRTMRAKSRVVSSLAMPFFWLLFIGVGIGSSLKLPGIDYINFLAPGILGMILLFNSMFSGMSIIWDRQFGFLKEILVAPISRNSVVLGKTLGGATVAVVTAVIMMIVSLAIGIIPLTFGVFPALVFMVLTAMIFVSLGLVIASRMRSMEGFQMVMTFLIMPVFFLSGAIFPIQNTPPWMQIVSHANPLTYGVDGIRGSFIGISLLPIWLDFAVLAGVAATLILLGGYSFKKSSMQ